MLAANSNSLSLNESRFAVGIGGLSIGTWCEKGMPVGIDPEHQPFLCAAPADSACDIELDVYWSPQFELPKSKPAFVSGGLWSAYTHSTGTKFYFCSSTLGTSPYKAAWFDENFERGHIVLNRSCLSAKMRSFPWSIPSTNW